MSQADAPAMLAENLPPEALFHVRNLDVARMGVLQWPVLILWMPIGLPLMLVRAAATILASLVIPPAYRPWWICTMAGVFTRTKGKTKMRDHGMVVVSNHLSYFDRMTVAAAVRSRVPLATLIWHKVNWLNAHMARPTIAVRETGRNRNLVDEIKVYLQHGNVLLFPEATVTDGMALLRFEKMAFSLEARVVIVALRYRRALPFLRSSALRERLFVQLFYDLFQPWSVAEMQVLGTHERREDETAEDFAKRAQAMIADALGVPTTTYTWRDRRRLLKQHGLELPGELERRKLLQKAKGEWDKAKDKVKGTVERVKSRKKGEKGQ